MKKTLVALAALAATSAFAQVSITGSLAMGYEMNSVVTAAGANSTADASGFGIDTSTVDFKASEDLGGGYKLDAAMQIDGMNRGGIAGGDSSLALTTGMGKLTFATVKGADYLSGGVAKVGGNGFDDKVFSKRTVNDTVTFAVPVGPLSISLTHGEPNDKVGIGAGAAGVAAAAADQRYNRLSARYTAGALVVDGGYAVYDQQGPDVGTGGNSKTDLRAAVSYDLGTMKFGGGIQSRALTGGTRFDYLLSMSVPMGALKLGVDFASRKVDSTVVTPAADGTKTGTGLSADYALSKRTSLGVYYTTYKKNVTDGVNSTYTAVLLGHNF